MGNPSATASAAVAVMSAVRHENEAAKAANVSSGLGLTAWSLPAEAVTAKGQQWATPITPSVRMRSVSPFSMRSSVWVAS